MRCFYLTASNHTMTSIASDGIDTNPGGMLRNREISLAEIRKNKVKRGKAYEAAHNICIPRVFGNKFRDTLHSVYGRENDKRANDYQEAFYNQLKKYCCPVGGSGDLVNHDMILNLCSPQGLKHEYPSTLYKTICNDRNIPEVEFTEWYRRPSSSAKSKGHFNKTVAEKKKLSIVDNIVYCRSLVILDDFTINMFYSQFNDLLEEANDVDANISSLLERYGDILTGTYWPLNVVLKKLKEKDLHTIKFAEKLFKRKNNAIYKNNYKKCHAARKKYEAIWNDVNTKKLNTASLMQMHLHKNFDSFLVKMDKQQNRLSMETLLNQPPKKVKLSKGDNDNTATIKAYSSIIPGKSVVENYHDAGLYAPGSGM
eukprot:g1720.t1